MEIHRCSKPTCICGDEHRITSACCGHEVKVIYEKTVDILYSVCQKCGQECDLRADKVIPNELSTEGPLA